MFDNPSQIARVEAYRASGAKRFKWVRIGAFALFSVLWSSNGFADCTIAKIRDCTRSDPAAAEKLLLREIAKSQQPSLLAQLGEFYRNAPQQFQDKAQAIWYLRRASNAGDASATESLAEMLLKGEAETSVTAVDQPAVTADPPPGGYDPPSTLAGKQLTIDEVLNAAYAAGFTTEDQLLPAIATAIAESQLFTQARNWQPDKGFRPASDAIGVPGPPEAWSADKRQMHSDRGLWQIGSKAWGYYYPDSATDDLDRAAKAAFLLSRGGLDFEIWDSFAYGRAQRHYDQALAGWPALRPLVKSFLSGKAPETVGAIPGGGSG